MAELLLELFSEEIPARMQARAADDLRRLAAGALKAEGLEFDAAASYVTPRRLALVVDGLPLAQPDRREEKRGPRVGAPEKAVQGFLRANNATIAMCVERDDYLYLSTETRGRAVADLLPGIVGRLIGDLAWPKSMRWGEGETRWVRTLERVLCVFDGKPVALDLPDRIESGGVTTGHRFHAPEPFSVSSFAEYRDGLRQARVILDPAERRRIVANGADELADAEGLFVPDDPGLLDEVVGLVEWPVPLMGRIDDEFMAVPEEVLITAMRSHQKYISLSDANGKLPPRFVVVANLEADDGGGEIVAGNERVLRARLSDARFFWDQDRKTRLEDRLAALEPMVFHAKLGTLSQKAARLETLAGEVATFVPGADVDAARRAGCLAKADLTTEMVFEFPELQGTMGGHYARHDGEDADVARAVAEHYLPAGPSGACPSEPVSVAVALADRIDTLTGFFAAGERPTGSGDPYALRRAALGVIRLVLENGVRLPLGEAFCKARQGYAETVPDFSDPPEMLERELLDFFADRLKVHLRAKGVRHDLIAAVFALGGEDDLVRLCARVEALRGFLATEDGANLLTAHKRAANIVAIEEKKDGIAYSGPVEPAMLREPEEKALNESLGAVGARSAPLVDSEAFDEAMSTLAGLRGPVDAFFDRVKVNADDGGLRANRLRLLSGIRTTMGSLADFSQIEG
ncbi:MAG: glycine--tRNA ligase subunit beta [Defluviicoccus sp.]|nr:glycine--tRNA ligase subunit beta [Defluviicoccus sp.]MDE0277056.1 glycine--tRNA ligase subunit beta [Defluviicoccus sp.]